MTTGQTVRRAVLGSPTTLLLVAILLALMTGAYMPKQQTITLCTGGPAPCSTTQMAPPPAK